MKLSEALELCIEKGYYGGSMGSRFMCHALESADQGEHVQTVMNMVWGIDPVAYALGTALKLDNTGLSSMEIFEACKAHYIKWIAELKEQGL